MRERIYNYPIVVRMDDICDTMDLEKFQRYREYFKSIKIKPLLGLVPDNKDPKLVKSDPYDGFRDLINGLKKEGWQISMHGVYHRYIGKSKGLVTKYGDTEFAGLSYDEQYKKLEHGKKCLESEGFLTDIFMPPSHSYDRNTLKALRNLGFRYITDGRSTKPYILDDIVCVPAISAYRLKICGVMTVCIHCNEDDEESFKKLTEFLTANKDCIISFEDAVGIQTLNYQRARAEELLSLFWTDRIVKTASKIIKRR